MPATITELYETASKAMLERVDRKERGAAASSAAVPHLTMLLEATFFEAHAAEVRDFGDEQLNRAAHALFAPDELKQLKEENERKLTADRLWESPHIPVAEVQGSSFEVGKKVTYQGEEMVVIPGHQEGTHVLLQKWSHAFLERKLEQLTLKIDRAELPVEAKEALRAVRERVAQDRLPLFRLIEATPLQMRSSHLSFQEYFAVTAICTGKHRLPRDSPPWKWGPFWTNVVKLGNENRESFGRGLLCAAHVEGDKLNLSRELGGDRLTVLGVVCALMSSLRVLNLSDNKLGPKGGAAVAEGLKVTGALKELHLGANELGDAGATAIVDALRLNSSLTGLLLGLWRNQIGDASASAIAEALRVSGSVVDLNVYHNNIGDEGAKVIGAALAVNGSLTVLSLAGNMIGDEGAKAIGAALAVNGSLTSLE